MAETEIQQPETETPEHEPLKPRMRRDEVVLLRSVARYRNTVVEFGCGGSTAEFLEHSSAQVVSVESDLAWIDRLRSHPALAEPLGSGRLTLRHADIGPVGAWGRPRGWAQVATWPAYWSDVWMSDELRGVENPADLVFVDGRFRVACALNAAIHLDESGLILMHDFFKRDHYSVLLDHLNVVASAAEMVVLQRSRDFDVRRAVDDLARFAVDVR